MTVGRALRAGLQFMVDNGDRHPAALEIIDEVDRWAKVPAGLLAWSTARFEDAKRLDHDDIQSTDPVTWTSGKTGKTRQVQPIWPDVPQMDKDAYDPAAELWLYGYGRAKRAIRRARQRARVGIDAEHLQSTHIFRHLHGAHLDNLGYTEEEIREEFGHSQKATTRRYIHENVRSDP